MPLYGDGLNVRDWLHVSDNCRALDLIIEAGTPGEVYNVGGGNHVKNVDLTRRILQLLGKPESLIRPVADRPGHDRRYSVDTAKLHALGWTPRIALRTGTGGHGGLVSAERVVVAADQGRRPRVPGVLQDPVRRSPGLRSGVAGLPLVTGATGFAGSHLVDHLSGARAGDRRLGEPAAARPSPRDDPKITWNAVDLLDREAVRDAIAALRPSVVYHCAGAADVGDIVGRSRHAARGQRARHAPSARGRAARRLEDHRRRGRLGDRLPASTDASTEDSPIGPSSPYGVSKLAQEMLGGARDRRFPCVLARPFNHAGPRQSPAFVTSSFARQIAEIEAGVATPC